MSFSLCRYLILTEANSLSKHPKRSAFLNMNSGAAIEYQALTWEICSDDGTTEGTHLERWAQLLSAGANAMGRDVRCVSYVEEWLKELGFVDIRRVQVLLPSKTTTTLFYHKVDTEKNF